MKIDLTKINLLCEEINMPDEVIGQVSKIITDNNFPDIEGYFNMLFSLKTAGEACKKIVSKLKENDYCLKPLAVYLAAALQTWELYEKLGIPRQIYTDTMKMFSRFVREHLQTHGFYGFDRDYWFYRILSASIFRLGELEFEMSECPNNDILKGYAVEGEKVISVHIPSDAVMRRENLDQSYKMAPSFFEKFFPEYKDKIIYCRTWLLDPALKNLLSEKSRILEFQSDYKIIEVLDEDSNFILWVYKKKIDNYSLLPEDTTLQKNMKKFLLSGGKISLATGIKI